MIDRVDLGLAFSGLEAAGSDQNARKLGVGLVANSLLVLVAIWAPSAQVARDVQAPRMRVVSLSRPLDAMTLPEANKPPMVVPKQLVAKARLLEPPRLAATPKLELPLPPEIAESHTAPAAILPPSIAALPAPKPAVGAFASGPTPVPQSERQVPQILTGAFVTAVAGKEKKENSSRVESGLFAKDEPQAVRGKLKSTVTQQSGFEDADPLKKGKARGEVVIGQSFGNIGREAPRERAAKATLANEFDTRPSKSVRDRGDRQGLADSDFKGVEIVSKPRPLYTEEARRLGIEGEVHLRILFGADGKLKVLAIVHGLGHGLDENAALAAAQIQFRPASKRGQAVEQAAMVRVQFQLAN